MRSQKGRKAADGPIMRLAGGGAPAASRNSTAQLKRLSGLRMG
jgi:hypothetical protein